MRIPRRRHRGRAAIAVLGLLLSATGGRAAAWAPIPIYSTLRPVVSTGAEAALDARLTQLENRVEALQQQVIQLQEEFRERSAAPPLLTPTPPAPRLPTVHPQETSPSGGEIPTLPSRDAVLIQMGYDAGAGRATILHPPAGWRTEAGTTQSSRQVRSVTMRGQIAEVVVRQDDRVTCTDPGAGERHLVESIRAWQDEWRKTPQGWQFSRHVLNAGGPDVIDGRVVADRD